MSTWPELEQRFRDLEPSLRDARIDYQFDDKGGEDFSLVGGGAPNRASFEALATIAGKLLTTLLPDAVPQDVLRGGNDRDRWFRALSNLVGPHQQPAIGYEHSDGAIIRTLTLAQIATPAAFSAALALRLQAASFVPATQSGESRSGVVAWLDEERRKRGTLWLVV